MRGESGFSPSWLTGRLEQLIPDFPDVSLCVALSGGVDSTALLAALARRRRGRPRIRAVHVDHGLHPNSAAWREHCEGLAKRLHIPLKVLTTKVRRARGESVEALAREARYRLLAEELGEGEHLLVAHHEDDQLETVLLQLFRGAGLAGLAAMPERARFAHGWIVRPLLTRSRAQLETWVRKQGLEWVEDATNVDESFDRNYLRRRILPLIRERWPGAATAVSRSARHLAAGQRLLDDLARSDVERASYGASLSVYTLRSLDPDRRRNTLRFWIARAGVPLPDTRRLEELAGPVLEARPDANPSVSWRGVIVQRHADLLSIRSAGEPAPLAPSGWSWRHAPVHVLPDGQGALELRRDPHGPVDLDALPEQLTIRPRIGGERLRPRRGGPSRSLKNLLQEARLPVAERANLPLLYGGESLLAVADLWTDASIQAGPKTPHRGRFLWRKNR